MWWHQHDLQTTSWHEVAVVGFFLDYNALCTHLWLHSFVVLEAIMITYFGYTCVWTCVIVVLAVSVWGIGCVHCWLFLWALIAKPVDCVIRLCCWIYDCSFHLAVIWILFRVSHCINFRELRLSDCPWGPCFELSPRSSPVELGFWGPFGLLVSIFTSRVFVWVRVNFDFCQC